VNRKQSWRAALAAVAVVSVPIDSGGATVWMKPPQGESGGRE
jgi:hypothetical protein